MLRMHDVDFDEHSGSGRSGRSSKSGGGSKSSRKSRGSQQNPNIAFQDAILSKASTQSDPISQRSTSTGTNGQLNSRLHKGIQTKLTVGPMLEQAKTSAHRHRYERTSVLNRTTSSRIIRLSSYDSWTYSREKSPPHDPSPRTSIRDVGANVRPIEGDDDDAEWILSQGGKTRGLSLYKGKLWATSEERREWEARMWNEFEGELGSELDPLDWGGEGDDWDDGGSHIFRQLEKAEKLLRERRKKPQQADAEVLSRPLGYRELSLYPRGKFQNKGIQVNPKSIDKTAAILRGRIVNQDNILWPTNAEFNIGLGEKKIEEYMTTCWGMCSRWSFHVTFLEHQTSCYSNKYIFEVKWSLPTKEYPIPMACASVFFVYQVDIYGGRDDQVGVHYVLEGNRFPHKPGETNFQQRWISDIICDKMRISRSVC